MDVIINNDTSGEDYEGRRSIYLTGVNAETMAIAQEDQMLKNAILDSVIVKAGVYKRPPKYLLGHSLEGVFRILGNQSLMENVYHGIGS